MTSTSPTLNLIGAPSEASATAALASTDRRVWAATIAIVLALYLLLENPYWVPGGDSEVYLAIARNLASGQGYMFNGQPARIAPPGWPMLLAAVIKFISPAFLALKLITLASMVGAMAIFYWIIRRFAPPLTAAAVVLLTAITSHVYSLTFWLHSDALFTLITAGMLLLALQINEGRSSPARIAALLLLCALAAFVRWAGVINLSIVVAALLSGSGWRRSRMWITAALTGIVIFTTFYGIRYGMRKFSRPRVAFEATAQIDLAAVQNDVQLAEGADTGKESQMPDPITGTRGHSGYRYRLGGYGTWFSYLLWQPFRLAAGIHLIWWIATLIGWIVIAIILAGLWPELRAMRWLLPATLLYTTALCLNWPHATARYLVPISPLIVLMIFRGLGILRDRATQLWQQRAVRALSILGLGSALLCNAALYAVDVWVMRQPDFYDHFEAGLNKGLIAAGQYLSEQQVGHWQTCVNPEYQNINRRRMSPTGLRIMTMLTGKAALQLPKVYTAPPYKTPTDREFRRFLGKNNVRYYLEQPAIRPWRVWHFRMGWLQEALTGEPIERPGAGWKLYRCDGASLPVQIQLSDSPRYPRRVPGFDDSSAD